MACIRIGILSNCIDKIVTNQYFKFVFKKVSDS